MKGQGGGGTAKGGGKTRSGGGAVKIEKTKARQTSEADQHIMTLRAALFEPSGKDKDVTAGISPAFLKYNRNGLDLAIEFSHRLVDEDLNQSKKILKDNMEDVLNDSGYGWDDEEKFDELKDKSSRFLLVRDNQTQGIDGNRQIVAFAHFRFTITGEIVNSMLGDPCLFVFDLQVTQEGSTPGFYRHKGLAKHLLVLLELIARREKMYAVCFPIYLHDEEALTWLQKASRNSYQLAESIHELHGFDPDVEGYEVYAKQFTASLPQVNGSAGINQDIQKVANSILQTLQLAQQAPETSGNPETSSDPVVGETEAKEGEVQAVNHGNSAAKKKKKKNNKKKKKKTSSQSLEEEEEEEEEERPEDNGASNPHQEVGDEIVENDWVKINESTCT